MQPSRRNKLAAHAERLLDDLATETARCLVVPGTIFYWTIGRLRNVAGTVTNLSLARFHRLSAPPSAQASQAEEEALELLRVLGDGHGSAPSWVTSAAAR